MSKYPTWADVYVPQVLVNSIKTMPPCYLLDSLVHQLIYRNQRRATYIYHCGVCGYPFRPERNSEEISGCLSCNSAQVSATTQMRFSKEVLPYSKRTRLLPDVLDNWKTRYIHYFRAHPGYIWLDCGWEEFNVYAQLRGGERIIDTSPRLCLIKAAILCPYLWDGEFDWNSLTKRDISKFEHLAPILNNYCHAESLGKKIVK